jgi:hypothetical protein
VNVTLNDKPVEFEALGGECDEPEPKPEALEDATESEENELE